MRSYAIFTESTGDLTPALIQQADLNVLPMTFNLDGTAYKDYPDGREISSKAFYDKLRAGSMCTTSQVSLAEYEDAFTPVLASGMDILYLSFSSGLSGTYQTSRLAVELLGGAFPRPQDPVRGFPPGQYGGGPVRLPGRVQASGRRLL